MALSDIKKRKIISIFPTTIIFLLIIYKIFYGYGLEFGILGFVLAWLLYEFHYYRGRADLKTIIIISLILENLNQFYLFMILLGVCGFIYQLVLSKITKYHERNNIPMIPLFFIVYIILWYLIFIF